MSYHHSRDLKFFDQTGHLFPYDIRYAPDDRAHCEPLPAGLVRFRLAAEPGFAEVVLVYDDGEVRSAALERWGADARFEHWEVVVAPDRPRITYSFALRHSDGRAVYRVPAGVSNAVERLDRWTFDLSKVPPYEVPPWARGATIYQVFPDRFRNGDPDNDPPGVQAWGAPPHPLRVQGGDLRGVAEKAGYLADLGVDVVYLNPVFTSPSNHKYDTVDYYAVDPALGGDPALRGMVKELHRRDMRVILDASFNHCHPRFFAFADVVERGSSSPYLDWFAIREFPIRVVYRPRLMHRELADAEPYLELIRSLPDAAGILLEEADDAGPLVEPSYEAWYGVPTMPRVDLGNPEARRYFLDVAAYWLREFDIDGWRMDVARYVDSDFWQDFRRVCKQAKPDCYLLAEVMGDASRWLQGDRFDATMNYTFWQLCVDYFATREADTVSFLDGWVRMLAGYAAETSHVNHNLLSSHDKPRFLHLAGEDRSRLALATLFQLTAPGAPGIYYGDEVGMSGGEEPDSRQAFPWSESERWDTHQLETTRTLLALRRRHAALRVGDWRLVWQGDEAFAFTREAEDEAVLVVVNRGPTIARAEIAVSSPSPQLLWGDGRAKPTAGGVLLEGIPASAGLVVLLASPAVAS